MSRPAPTLFRGKHIEHQSYSLMRDLLSLFLPVRATSNSGRKRREIEHKNYLSPASGITVGSSDHNPSLICILLEFVISFVH